MKVVLRLAKINAGTKKAVSRRPFPAVLSCIDTVVLFLLLKHTVAQFSNLTGQNILITNRQRCIFVLLTSKKDKMELTGLKCSRTLTFTV